MAVNHVASARIPFTRSDKAFFKGLFGPILSDDSGGSVVRYLKLENRDNFLCTDALVIRPCYEHLLPHIHNPLYLEDSFRGAVTGTPGIGKTVFGVYLLRHFVIERKETVLYWARKKIYLFSFEERVKVFFGLTDGEIQVLNDGSQQMLYTGKWNSDGQNTDWTQFISFAEEYSVIFIHDPEENETEVSTHKEDIPRLIFILSHGHKLISLWRAKGHAIRYFYMPIWTKQEAEQSKQFLKCIDYTVADLHQDEIDNLYRRFGGCIRGWVNNELWTEIEAKISEIVRNLGDNVLQKTANSRGSVVHLEVDFDEKRPILPLMDEDASQKALDNGSDDGDDQKPNDFNESRYIFGSEKILEVFQEKILNRGEETLRMCLTNWAGQNGFESVYGALFELHCHRMLENNDGQLRLNMRIVYRDKEKNNNDVYSVTVPMARGTCRYPSNDPSILEEDQHKEDAATLGIYFWPVSSNHPTYDSAFVVNGKDLGVNKVAADKVALLLQMTVSGATGLPRRPAHSVKQHIRKKFENVFKKRIDGYKQSGEAYTAFMVPTECFKPFLFQDEEVLNGEAAASQPEFQLVFEVPKVFTYKKGSPRGTTMASGQFGFGKKRKTCHAYDEEISSQSH